METLKGFTITETCLTLFTTHNRTIKCDLVFDKDLGIRYVNCNGVDSNTGEIVAVPHIVADYVSNKRKESDRWAKYLQETFE